ncbi:reverse transcriptase domain-containing protein [Tanacetum coccineum]
MIQEVQQSCQYHGLPGNDANKHIDKFLTVTRIMKQNEVPHDILCLCLFPYSLTHHAIAWFDRLPKNSIHSWEEMVTKFISKYFPISIVTKLRNDISNFRQLPGESLFEAWERYKLTLRHRDTIDAAAGGTFMKRRPKECYDLIENMTAHHNDLDTSAQRGESSRLITSSSPKIAALTQQIAKMNKNFLRMSQSNQQVNVVNLSFETCGAPHHYSECHAAGGFTQGDVYAATGNCNAGVPSPNSSSSKEVEQDPETTIDQVHISSSGSTARVPSLVIQPAPASKSNDIPKRNPQQPPIPYPLRLNKDKLHDAVVDNTPNIHKISLENTLNIYVNA